MLRFKNQINEETYASNELMWNILNNLIPIGSIIPFGGNDITSPMFKLCDGSVLDRIKYKVLFSVIGTTYGEGDGVSTFNLPNLIGRFLEGATETGIIKEAGLPDITGYVQYPPAYNATGAFKKSSHNTSYRQIRGETSTTYYSGDIRFNASDSNPIYGKSNTVQPNSLTMNYIIRVI